MDAVPSIAALGSLIGSHARASMLSELFDGRALTATELSHVADVSPATASEHLGKLVAAGLLICEQHGRHRYFRLAGSHVAEAIEPLFHFVQGRAYARGMLSPKSKALSEARLCYDHLAGRLGVAITDAMVNKRWLIASGQDYALTAKGEAFCTEMGIDLCVVRSKRRMFARRCLDWSERKPHLAGALGAAVTAVAFDRGWIKRANRRRVVTVTNQGRAEIANLLGLNV